MSIRGHTVGAVVLLGALAGTAQAGPVRSRITKASALITEDLRYDPAITILERALADARITNAERIDAYRLLGLAYVARGNTESAEDAFGALLAIDPTYELDERLSPKILEVFARARNDVQSRPKILEVMAIPEGRRVVVSGRLTDPERRLTAVDLYTRAGGEGFDRQVMSQEDGHLEAFVAVPVLDRLRVDYYLIGRRGEDAIVAVGDAGAPLSVIVDRPSAPAVAPPPPIVTTTPDQGDGAWYTTWWFWTAAGVVVVGAVVGTVLMVPGEPPPPPGTLDPIRL